MSARVGVVVFPGSNCEHDVVRALEAVGGHPELVWHTTTSLTGLDAIVIPGGFAHGDYLRPGALARFSPVMHAVDDMARAGAPVVGICNGFQVLTEAGLLPGALWKNRGMRFICDTSTLSVGTSRSAVTGQAEVGSRLRVPINHFEGSFICDPGTLHRLQEEDRVVLRYVDNPNGSVDDIAAVCNETGNVVGLMPHPERACDELSGSADGAVLLRSLLASAAEGDAVIRSGSPGRFPLA